MSSGEKPIVTLKISVTKFCRFQYFEDFDSKFLLLGQPQHKDRKYFQAEGTRL